jgi:2-hydroxy-6-oxonona-2,4-dienedioate hydrolase
VSALGEAAAEWSRARRVRVGAWEVRYREAGRGLPVVLAHGLGVSTDYWWRNGSPLAAAGFRVLAPDLPGFGRTPGPEEGLSVPAQAEALAAFADAVDLGPAVYLGHSLSCQAALELAVHQPERVRALVLAAPTGAPGTPAQRLLRQAKGLLLDAAREPWSLVPWVGQAYLRAGVPRVWRTWRMGTEHDPLPLLPRVRVPTLVVVGTRDPVVPKEFAERLAEGLAEGRLAWIDGGAHAVHFDRAEAFNRAVAAFLRGLPG